MNKIITIDGPAGSGKSTIAKKLAQILNYAYLDTGAMYRTIAYLIKKHDINISDDKNLEKFLNKVEAEFLIEDNSLNISADKEKIIDQIRTPEIGELTSKISKIKIVRDFLTAKQREIGAKHNIVCEGRDMGSFVFPNANLKIYLTCDENERIKRRIKQNELLKINSEISKIKKEIEFRDREDSSREHAPLCVPKNARIIDSTLLTIDEIIQEILK